MSKKNSMQEEVEKTEKGEQINLIDIGPENGQAIIEAVRIYKGHQHDRLASLKLELKAKEKVKRLVKEAGLQHLPDGTIKFTYEKVAICIKPRDELITITEVKPKKPKKGKK